ncbi:MAG: L-2-amino-thiazoline-4-carboxylic acid hydrolase [Thermodesulfobacteriota bacterium]
MVSQGQKRDIFKVDLKELNQEERLAFGQTISWEILGRVFDAVEERYGKEGRELLNKVVRDYMREITPRIAQSLGIVGNDMASVLEVINWHDVNLWPLMDEDIAKSEEREGMLRINNCFLKDRWTPHECKIGIPYVEGMLEALNPKIKYKATKLLTLGDDCCELVMKLED